VPSGTGASAHNDDVDIDIEVLVGTEAPRRGTHADIAARQFVSSS
jgi:hypothetical protein